MSGNLTPQPRPQPYELFLAIPMSATIQVRVVFDPDCGLLGITVALRNVIHCCKYT